MTTVGVLSDIHGCFPALSAVYEELQVTHDVDTIVCCGDVVGVLGYPLHCVHMVDGVVDHVVIGNHDCRVRDEYAYAPSFPAAHDEHTVVTEILDEQALSIVADWPERVETRDFIVAHSFPTKVRDSDRSITGFTKDDRGCRKRHVTEVGPHADGKFVFLGHSHEQFEQSVDKFPGQSGHVVNPGSVGVPWYEPAEYAVVDLDTGEVNLCSVEYDYEDVRSQLNKLDERYGLRTWDDDTR